MKRRIFTILSAVSLLLAVAVTVLWVRSYWYNTFLAYKFPTSASHLGREVYAALDDGDVRLSHRVETMTPLWHEEGKFRFYDYRPGPPMNDVTVSARSTTGPTPILGFEFWVAEDPGSHRYVYATVPVWSLAVIAATSPICWALIRLRQRNRFRGSLCLSCGYDLRASKDKCPECGAAIPPAPA